MCICRGEGRRRSRRTRTARWCRFTDADGKAQTKQAEKVLVAVGRAPRTYDIGLDKMKITPDRGFIMTNEWMETTEPGVYAIGDIVGGMPQLAHVGAMAGLVVAARLAGKYAKPVNRQRIPGCTYCDPQIGARGDDGGAGEGEGLPGEGRASSRLWGTRRRRFWMRMMGL